MPTELWVILGLVIANGLLSGAEMAVITVRSSRVKELVLDKRRGALALQRLRAHPERFLATVQVGITLVSAIAAAYGGSSLAASFAGMLERWGLDSNFAASLAFGVVVVGISGLSVILGELVPKSLALRSSEKFALLMSRPLSILASLGSPVVWALTATSNLLLRPFGDKTNFTETRLSSEELRSLVEEASEAGTVHPDVGDIATRALDLAGLMVNEVMVHRRFVTALPKSADAATLKMTFTSAGHRRLPVFDGSIDNIVGYVSWRDLVNELWEGRNPAVVDLLREAPFVPERSLATLLLKDMQKNRQHMAVVVDEHGGFSGIVTMEDILEELVGEIVSEHDEELPKLKQEPTGTHLVQGTSALRDIDRELELNLDKLDESTTIGGLCVALSGGRVPRPAERIHVSDQAEIEVVESSPRRVRLVRIRQLKQDDGESEPGQRSSSTI